MSRVLHTEPPAWLMSQDWPPESRQARAKLVWQLRGEGYLLREIAALVGLKSHKSAAELIYDPDGSKLAARRRKSAQKGACVDCGAITYSRGTQEAPPVRCRAHAQQHVRTYEGRVNFYGRREQRWTDEQICEAIRSVAASDGTVSVTDYDATYKSVPKGSMPSRPTIVIRFGRWALAVERAGLRPRGGNRGPYSMSLSPEGALLIVAAVATAAALVVAVRDWGTP